MTLPLKYLDVQFWLYWMYTHNRYLSSKFVLEYFCVGRWWFELSNHDPIYKFLNFLIIEVNVLLTAYLLSILRVVSEAEGEWVGWKNAGHWGPEVQEQLPAGEKRCLTYRNKVSNRRLFFHCRSSVWGVMPALNGGMDSLLRLKRAVQEGAAEAVTQATAATASPQPPAAASNGTDTGGKNVGDKMKDALMNELKKLPCKLNQKALFMFLNVHYCKPLFNPQ